MKNYTRDRFSPKAEIHTESRKFSDFKHQILANKQPIDVMYGMGIRHSKDLIQSIMQIVYRLELADISTISTTYALTRKDLDTYSGPYFNTMLRGE